MFLKNIEKDPWFLSHEAVVSCETKWTGFSMIGTAVIKELSGMDLSELKFCF